MSNLELVCDNQFNAFEIDNCKLSFESDSLETAILIDYGYKNDSNGKETLRQHSRNI